MRELKHLYKVGDELAFRCGSHTHYWMIEKITKVTPSGRIQCGSFSLNPDMTVRGKRDSWHGPFQGEPVTEEIRREIEEGAARRRDYATVAGHNWKNTPASVLAEVAAILRRNQSSA